MSDAIKRPNLLFLFPDQHRGDWMPYDERVCTEWGMSPLPLRMPNVARLMSEGTTFVRAVTSSPLCAPARACLAAGVRYEQCGVESNGADYPLDKKTVYTELRERGYAVGGVGKFDLHKKTEWWGLDGWLPELETLGFTHGIDNAGKLDAVRSGAREPQDPYMKYLYERGLAQAHLQDMNGRLGDNRMNTRPTTLPDEAYCDNWLTVNGLQVIREFPDDQPWFLAVNFTGPHHPWDVTEAMKSRWQDVDFPPPVACSPELLADYNAIRQNYAAMLENIDHNIGLLLDEVEARGDLENTIVIYVSDHGEMLGDFDAFNKSRPERGSVHIPLVAAGPGIARGRTSHALVELQDLTATLLDYSRSEAVPGDEANRAAPLPGAEVGAMGISLRPILEGRQIGHREYQYSALGDWKMVATRTHKLILQTGREDRLYDLAADPWELRNIAGVQPQVAEEMKNMAREVICP